MKKLILLSLFISSRLLANDTVSVQMDSVPQNVTVIAVYDEAGRVVQFGAIGFTIVLLSDNTVRKFYRYQ